MEYEVVQHERRPAAVASASDDPAVGLGIVADVVEGDVRGNRTRAAAAHDLDLDQPAEGGQQQGGVVRNARTLGGSGE
jgi:hypothetical protein